MPASSSPRRSTPGAGLLAAQLALEDGRRSRDRPRLSGAVWKFSGRSAIARADDSNGVGIAGIGCRAVKSRSSVLVAALAARRGRRRRGGRRLAPPRENPCAGPERQAPALPRPADRPAERNVRLRPTAARCCCTRPPTSRSRGRGPMELHGQRNGPETMRVDAADLQAPAAATSPCAPAPRLHFTDVGAYFGGSYWKVHQLARFELRRVAARRRARPGGADEPEAELLPARPRADPARAALARRRATTPAATRTRASSRDTLGTSVGWSDIYPADYDKQYIDVSGLRGCFAFAMTGRPQAPPVRVERARQLLAPPRAPPLHRRAADLAR